MPALVAIECASCRIGRVGGDAGHCEARRVGQGDVPAIPVEDHGPVGRRLVQQLPGRELAFGQRLIIEADANESLAGRQVSARGRDAVEQIGEVGGPFEGQATQSARIADRMKVGVGQTRDDRAAGESVFPNCRPDQLDPTAHRVDPSGRDQHGIGARMPSNPVG